MRCTGRCCGPIRIWRGGEPITLADLCAIVDREYGGVDNAKLKALLLPSPSAEHVNSVTCRAFDTVTRRCQVYDDRPEMCRDYPNNQGDVGCAHCGARSDAEARGVAMEITR